MSEEEKYAGTTAIGRLVYHIKRTYDFLTHVDGKTIEFTPDEEGEDGKLRVKPGSIGVEQVSPTFLADLPYIGAGSKSKAEWSFNGPVSIDVPDKDPTGSDLETQCVYPESLDCMSVFDSNGTCFVPMMYVDNKTAYEDATGSGFVDVVSISADGVKKTSRFEVSTPSEAPSTYNESHHVMAVPEEQGCTVIVFETIKNYQKRAAVIRVDASGNVARSSKSNNVTNDSDQFKGNAIAATKCSNGNAAMAFIDGCDGSYPVQAIVATPDDVLSHHVVPTGVTVNTGRASTAGYSESPGVVLIPAFKTSGIDKNPRWVKFDVDSLTVVSEDYSFDRSLGPGIEESLSVGSSGNVTMKKREPDFSVSTTEICPVPTMVFTQNSFGAVLFSGACSGFTYDDDSVYVPGTTAGYAVSGGVANYAKNTTNFPSGIIGPNTGQDVTYFDEGMSKMTRFERRSSPKSSTQHIMNCYFGKEVSNG